MVGRRRWVLGAGAWVAATVALGCGKTGGGGAPSGGGAPAEDGPIVVGGYFSLSGSDSTFGIDSREGIELALEQQNGAGGVKGRKVKVLFEDDKSNPQEASNKVKQLIDRDKVVALLGEVASSRSLAGGLVANNAKVPMVTPSSTNVTVTQGRDYVFRVCFTDDVQGQQAAHFALEKLGKKKIAVLYAAQDAYSSGLATSFKEEAKKLGATIVSEKGYQKGDTNFTTYLSEIKAAGPEIVFVPNYYNEMVQIARQAKDLGFSGESFLGGDGWDSEELLKGAAKELDGAYFTNHYAPDVPWANSQAFVTAYRAKYKREPTSLSAQAYDAAKLTFDAIGRAAAVTPAAIRDALAATKGFQGATGSITMDANRNAQKPIVIVQVKDGKFKFHSAVGAAGN